MEEQKMPIQEEQKSIQSKDNPEAPIFRKLEDLSVIELKALVYDRLVLIEKIQKEEGEPLQIKINNVKRDMDALNAIIAKKLSGK